MFPLQHTRMIRLMKRACSRRCRRRTTIGKFYDIDDYRYRVLSCRYYDPQSDGYYYEVNGSRGWRKRDANQVAKDESQRMRQRMESASLFKL